MGLLETVCDGKLVYKCTKQTFKSQVFAQNACKYFGATQPKLQVSTDTRYVYPVYPPV